MKICVERSILNQTSPFFLQRHLVLQDANDWWRGQGGILSVGDGVIDRGVHPKCINLIKRIEHVVMGNILTILCIMHGEMSQVRSVGMQLRARLPRVGN